MQVVVLPFDVYSALKAKQGPEAVQGAYFYRMGYNDITGEFRPVLQEVTDPQTSLFVFTHSVFFLSSLFLSCFLVSLFLYLCGLSLTHTHACARTHTHTHTEREREREREREKDR